MIYARDTRGLPIGDGTRLVNVRDSRRGVVESADCDRFGIVFGVRTTDLELCTKSIVIGIALEDLAIPSCPWQVMEHQRPRQVSPRKRAAVHRLDAARAAAG